MKTNNKVNYLTLIKEPSVENRMAAMETLTGLHIRALTVYEDCAIEVLASRDEAQLLRDSQLFKGIFKSAITKEHFERLSDRERIIAGLWNERFSPEYRAKTKNKKHYGKSWGGHKDLKEPLPYTRFDEVAVMQEMDKYFRDYPEAENTKGFAELAGKHRSETFARFEKAKTAPEVLHNLKTLYDRLSPRYKKLLLLLDWEIIENIIKWFFLEAACWKMNGEISVGIVFVESSRDGGPEFGTTERNEICDEIITGLNWLASQQPAGNLTWVMDFQFVRIDVADGTGDPDEAYWRDPAVEKITYHGATYTADWSGIADYREDMRRRNFSRHAYVIFVTPYNNSWYAYAGGGRLTLANKDNWAGWGQDILDTVSAHETSHLFGAMDEYTGSGTPCSDCEAIGGCDKIPNGNCGACARPSTDCMMAENEHRICDYTKGHIGWSDMFVELWTADDAWAGTDDHVEIDIGERVFTLDNSDVDDRERNNRNGYAIWDNGISRDEIKRVLIRKGEDGFAGGWELQRVRVFHNGEIICDQSPGVWLEDDKCWWIGCTTDDTLVNTLTVKISTADESWAGTDDDVSITLGGHTWDLDNSGHNDFERGNTDTFELDPKTGLHISDITSVRISKSSDGFAGGWKLKGVQIIVNGGSIFNNQGINKWLEDDDRIWSSAI
jgi:hypothetical protein